MHVDTALYLPAGWRDRLISWPLRSSNPADPHFLDPHDLAVAKLGAHRPKDLDFVDALLEARMLDLAELKQRCALVPDDHADVRRRALSFLNSYTS